MSFGTATFCTSLLKESAPGTGEDRVCRRPRRNFYRPAVGFLQLMEDFFHESCYGRFGKKVVESYTGAGSVDCLVFEKRRRKMPFIIDRDKVIKVGMIDCPEEVHGRDRLDRP